MTTLPQPGLYFRQDWYTTPEAASALDSLYPHRTSGRGQRSYGLLDTPVLPARTADNQAFSYKVYLRGKSGVGKSATISRLAGLPVHPAHYQTPGVTVTQVFWPCKHIDGRIIVIRLEFWDAGDTAIAKFQHMLPSMKEKADGVVFVFSFSDRPSFEDVPHMMARTLEHTEDVCKFVLGTKVDHNACQEVSLREIRDFERSWRLPVFRLANTVNLPGQQTTNPMSAGDLARTLLPLCEALWHRDQVLTGLLPAQQRIS